MPITHRISPCLWFDSQAEEAAKFYTGIFPNSGIDTIVRYGKAGQEHHRRPEGSVMVVDFRLDGQLFSALNGGPVFRFNEAISLLVDCETQEELDHYWSRLGDGGDERAQQCGWLKDRYGVSWQIVSRRALELVSDPGSGSSQRAMQALMEMKKIDIATLERAYRG